MPQYLNRPGDSRGMYQNHLLQELQKARLYVQGVRVDNIDSATALSSVESLLRASDANEPRQVFFTNVHSIHIARSDNRFQRLVNEADLVLPDGSGLITAGRVLGYPILENLNGTDFIPQVLRRATEIGWTVYLFGAQPGVAERCAAQLRRTNPGLKIVGHHHGHIAKEEEHAILSDINAKKPDILLVALGSPLQETWIARNTPGLRVGVCFAVGGLFDFLSGQQKRAPYWIRKIGAESVYRFMKDPRAKWRRVFLEQPLFLYYVLLARCFPRSRANFITQSYDN